MLTFDYPDYDEYPMGFYPIISALPTDHDKYAPEDAWNEKVEDLRLKRWAKRCQPAELVGVLLATAQKQLKRVDRSRHDGSEDTWSQVCTFCTCILNTEDLTFAKASGYKRDRDQHTTCPGSCPSATHRCVRKPVPDIEGTHCY